MEGMTMKKLRTTMLVVFAASIIALAAGCSEKPKAVPAGGEHAVTNQPAHEHPAGTKPKDHPGH